MTILHRVREMRLRGGWNKSDPIDMQQTRVRMFLAYLHGIVVIGEIEQCTRVVAGF